MTDEELIKGLRRLCGYIENGSDTTVKIFQDDATKTWVVYVGKEWFHGDGMRHALLNAIEGTPEQDLGQ